jgi:hypothetical protein
MAVVNRVSGCESLSCSFSSSGFFSVLSAAAASDRAAALVRASAPCVSAFS